MEGRRMVDLLRQMFTESADGLPREEMEDMADEMRAEYANMM